MFHRLVFARSNFDLEIKDIACGDLGASLKFLVDTNVLLNGLYNPYAPSREVLVQVSERRIEACVSCHVIGEARRRVIRCRQETAVNLVPALEDYLASNAVPIIEDSGSADNAQLQGINKKDRPVIATALNEGLVVCTNDMEDYREASALGLKITTPAELAHGGSIGLHTVFRLSLMNAMRGAIFIRFRPHWVDTKYGENAPERFCIFDQVGLGTFFYSAATASFCFEGETIPSVSLRVGVIRQDQLPVLLVFSYNENEGVRIVYGLDAVSTETSGHWSGKNIRLGEGAVTHDRAKASQLCGHVQILSTFPTSLTVKAARRLINDLTVPDPQERLSLEDIALRLYA